MSTTAIQIQCQQSLPEAVFVLFFRGKPICYKGNPLQIETLRLRSGKGTLKKTKVGSYLYVEQNPNSGSKFAQMAKKGHQILWIIHEPTGRYVGKVVDREVTKL